MSPTWLQATTQVWEHARQSNDARPLTYIAASVLQGPPPEPVLRDPPRITETAGLSRCESPLHETDTSIYQPFPSDAGEIRIYPSLNYQQVLFALGHPLDNPWEMK
ncbi:hypothetical protein CIHG_09380 [Coccidioides immitis H538.4]|uniref:Uncharacterized protein n=1 Tax=Coccidioides immitis H538.4 TaxID=396776 RepID=A0A0J8S2C8_COCIT|nr:hypothetical protein CIHG_09380 [Coccidioides immitis H538.4]